MSAHVAAEYARVKDIISLIGFLMLLGAVVRVMAEPIKLLGTTHIFGFSIFIMTMIILIVVFSIHVFADVIRLSQPDFTTPFDDGHFDKKRGLKDLFKKGIWTFSISIASVIMLCQFMVQIFLA
jgi:hypothetical protein